MKNVSILFNPLLMLFLSSIYLSGIQGTKPWEMHQRNSSCQCQSLCTKHDEEKMQTQE